MDFRIPQDVTTTQTHDLTLGKINSLTHGGATVTFDWENPVGGLPGAQTFSHLGSATFSATRKADDGGRLEEIRYTAGNSEAAATAVPFLRNEYTFDAQGHRQQTEREAGQPGWTYGYDSGGKGQVISAQRGSSQFSYAYDLMGNRTLAQVNGVAGADQETSYASNELNQYTAITHPDPLKREILGTANTSAQVQITSTPGVEPQSAPAALSVTRQAGSGPTSLYQATAAARTESGPAWRKIRIQATGSGPNGNTLSAAKEGWLYFPPRDEALTYDEDGNQTTDARWEYFWDAENRLKGMQEKDLGLQARPADAPARQRLEFAYDSQSRRVRKVVKEWSAQQSNWVLKQDTRFLYDGWNLIAEFEMKSGTSNLKLTTTYAWGLDLSGTETGAGGVGGLLLVQLHSSTSTTVNNSQPPQTPLAPAYDGNGNILAYVDCATGQPAARYEYDPFGRVLMKEESPKVAGKLHHQFSTKYCDSETGLNYYGFRYYSPEMGRWVSRDPIGERGGLNLYGMVGNDPVNHWDKLGLWNPLEGFVVEIVDRVTNPGVTWNPPPCTTKKNYAGETRYIQIYWFNSTPKDNSGTVDSGTGGINNPYVGSKHEPFYPQEDQDSNFTDKPAGLFNVNTTFEVCRVCYETCPSCIISVGPCKKWKRFDSGDLDYAPGTDQPSAGWWEAVNREFPGQFCNSK